MSFISICNICMRAFGRPEPGDFRCTVVNLHTVYTPFVGTCANSASARLRVFKYQYNMPHSMLLLSRMSQRPCICRICSMHVCC